MMCTEATLKFLKLITQAQQCEAVVQGRSLPPYRLRYICVFVTINHADFWASSRSNAARSNSAEIRPVIISIKYLS
ncbi:MAG: hypothetical protein LBJ00_10730 [Planctomycetaceae bacterium]|nr:hypothetical protein [Planctomycetaceae bacterium]